MRDSPPSRPVLALLLAAALVLGPCPARAEDLPAYTITVGGARISPARLEVPAKRKIKLVIRNEGPGPCEFENLDLRVEKVLAPGAASFVVVHPLKPGIYRFVDEFHPDTGQMTLVAR